RNARTIWSGSLASARAGDRHVALAAADAGVAAGGRHRAGNLVLVDLLECACAREGLRLAIGGRNRSATSLAIGQATVDAVAVRIVRNDEGTVFRGSDTAAATRNEERGPNDLESAHERSPAPQEALCGHSMPAVVYAALTVKNPDAGKVSATPRSLAPVARRRRVSDRAGRSRARRRVPRDREAGRTPACSASPSETRRGEARPRRNRCVDAGWRAGCSSWRPFGSCPLGDAAKHAALISRLTPHKVHCSQPFCQILQLTGLKSGGFRTFPGDVGARMWRAVADAPFEVSSRISAGSK